MANLQGCTAKGKLYIVASYSELITLTSKLPHNITKSIGLPLNSLAATPGRVIMRPAQATETAARWRSGAHGDALAARLKPLPAARRRHRPSQRGIVVHV